MLLKKIVIILAIMFQWFFINAQNIYKVKAYDTSYFCETKGSFYLNEICDSLSNGVYFVYMEIDKKGNYEDLIEIINYSDGKRNGKSIRIREGVELTQTEEYFYQNGIKTDSAYFYTINSITKDTIFRTNGKYCNGLACGIWRTYDKNNLLFKVIYYLDNGVLHGPVIVYENGHPIIKEEYYYGIKIKK